MPHKWTESDDLAALYADKFGTEQLHISIEELATRKGIEVGSFRMRILNFRALDGGGGLDHYADQSKRIYDQYHNLSEPELRRMAFPSMIQSPRYVHTNLIARDWRALAQFYTDLFGCEFVPPERNYAGAALEAGTGIPGATLSGVHLRLPGNGPQGPTLEIYTYSRLEESGPPAVNRPGFAHIAFEVASVADARREVLAAGGAAVGEIVTLTNAAGRKVTWCYVTDPEGNIIELQSWD